MADWYVKSGATGANNGTSWADAFTTLAAAFSAKGAGDTIYVASTHSEPSVAGNTIYAGTSLPSPVRVISVAEASPPTTPTSGAALTSTGSLTFNQSQYIEGLTITVGAMLQLANSTSSTGVTMKFKDCKLRNTSAGSGGVWSVAQSNVPCKMIFENCQFKWGHANNQFIAQHAIEIIGGGLESGTLTPGAFLTLASDGRGGTALIDGFDFSNAGASTNLVRASSSTSTGSYRCVFRNCRLPNSWSGQLVQSGGTNLSTGQRIEMHNCDNFDTNYRLWIEDGAGSIKSETTVVRTGGATDGTTPMAWKMVSSTGANNLGNTLLSPEIFRWNETIDTPITVSVDILHDSVTNLKDDQIWLEVMAMTTSGNPIATVITDAKANILAAGADQEASSATWTTTGLTNPNKQKLSVTFTPRERGYLVACVHLGAASKTVYVDPKIQVS